MFHIISNVKFQYLLVSLIFITGTIGCATSQYETRSAPTQKDSEVVHGIQIEKQSIPSVEDMKTATGMITKDRDKEDIRIEDLAVAVPKDSGKKMTANMGSVTMDRAGIKGKVANNAKSKGLGQVVIKRQPELTADAKSDVMLPNRSISTTKEKQSKSVTAALPSRSRSKDLHERMKKDDVRASRAARKKYLEGLSDESRLEEAEDEDGMVEQEQIAISNYGDGDDDSALLERSIMSDLEITKGAAAEGESEGESEEERESVYKERLKIRSVDSEAGYYSEDMNYPRSGAGSSSPKGAEGEYESPSVATEAVPEARYAPEDAPGAHYDRDDDMLYSVESPDMETSSPPVALSPPDFSGRAGRAPSSVYDEEDIVHRDTVRSGSQRERTSYESRRKEEAEREDEMHYSEEHLDIYTAMPSMPGTREYVAKEGESEGESVREEEADEEVTASETTTVERYPTMKFTNEEKEEINKIEIGKVLTVKVSLTKEIETLEVVITEGGSDKLRMPLPLPEGEKWEIGVDLATDGFTFKDGINSKSITLPKNGNSTIAEFELLPKVTATRQNISTICATLFHRNKRIGKFVRNVIVINPSIEAEHETSADSMIALKPQKRKPISVPDSQTDPDTEIDLTVIIYEKLGRITIDSRYFKRFNVPYSSDPGLSKWVNQKYSKIYKCDKKKSIGRLEKIGEELYKNHAPAAFKKAFWKLMDDHKDNFKTIQICSDNPIIPWELMRPTRGSDVCEALGLTFDISRWYEEYSDEIVPIAPNSIKFDRLSLIAPEYKGRFALPEQKNEIKEIKTISGYDRVVANYSTIKELFENLPRGIVHFTGHGAVEGDEVLVEIEGEEDDTVADDLFADDLDDVNDTESELFRIQDYAILLDENEIFDLDDWSPGKGANKGANPLLFFNACEIGKAYRVTNFVDGWAPAFLEGGASGYIGGLWPLRDKSSAEFAIQFYQKLKERLEEEGSAVISQILRETRSEFLKNKDTTFMAYILYGDPNLTVVKRGE